ncbi:hypothetical protein [Streptomyces sp. NPDC046759]|uniref:hypothetical protein n=1 Tax=Streptomyces sp. NPDC046759 TaxID=3155019 RepID=UPI0033D1DA65
MSAWIMLGAGCFFVAMGVFTLSGRGTAAYTPSPWAGWGWIAMGGGFVLDGGPKLLGFSSAAAAALSAVAMGLIVLGAVLQVWRGAFAKARRAGDGD